MVSQSLISSLRSVQHDVHVVARSRVPLAPQTHSKLQTHGFKMVAKKTPTGRCHSGDVHFHEYNRCFQSFSVKVSNKCALFHFTAFKADHSRLRGF